MKRLLSIASTTPVLAMAFLFLAPPGRLAADIAYAISGAGGGSSTLYTIDPTTGNTISTIGAVTVGGTGVMVSGIAFNPIDLNVYGAAVDPVTGKGELLTINLTTGAATVVGQFGFAPPSTNVTSLAFSSSGTLYGYAKTGTPSESLFTISTATGAATVVGGSGISSSSGDGMAMSASGTLYFAGKGATGSLYTLNTATGAATAGPTLSNAPLTLSQIKGLAFSSSGTLYGIDLQPTSFLADLITIDPSTGIITTVGATQNGLISVAFVTPEPGSFALMGFPALAWFIRANKRTRRILLWSLRQRSGSDDA